MFEFITASANLPFSIALALMLTIAGVEISGLFLGLNLSDTLDELLPDFDASVETDAELGASSVSPAVLALEWLQFGHLPFLIILILFLSGFGLSGYLFQQLAWVYLGEFLSGSMASAGAFFTGIYTLRWIGKPLARLIGEKTSAVSQDSFIGKVVTISSGTAKKGMPTQAKFKDEHGRSHYLMVEPDAEGVEFKTGTSVVVLVRNGTTYQCSDLGL